MASRLGQEDDSSKESAQKSPSEKVESDNDMGTSESEYPSVLIRTIVVSSLMLSIFLVLLSLSICDVAC